MDWKGDECHSKGDIVGNSMWILYLVMLVEVGLKFNIFALELIPQSLESQSGVGYQDTTRTRMILGVKEEDGTHTQQRKQYWPPGLNSCIETLE